jgi:hypothetical protein
MKKTELKKILKPIITECVREAILEDGILSGIISEVARGVRGVQINESRPQTTPQKKVDPTLQRMQKNAFTGAQTALKEQKNRLMEAIGGDAYNGVNLFEGTDPAPAQQNMTEMANPLVNQSPTDAGVNISNLLGSVGHNWEAHMSGLNLKEDK